MTDTKYAPVLDEIRQRLPRLDFEPDHPLQVCKIALELFDKTTALHGFGHSERCLLEAGALLHDTGHQRGIFKHHKHSREIIMGLHLPTLSEGEQKMIALIARYHRKANPRPGHKLYRELDAGAQETVRRLAALVRIADGLDRSHMDATTGLDVTLRGATVRILVHQRSTNPTDLWGGERKRLLFEEVFSMRVKIEAA